MEMTNARKRKKATLEKEFLKNWDMEYTRLEHEKKKQRLKSLIKTGGIAQNKEKIMLVVETHKIGCSARR